MDGRVSSLSSLDLISIRALCSSCDLGEVAACRQRKRESGDPSVFVCIPPRFVSRRLSDSGVQPLLSLVVGLCAREGRGWFEGDALAGEYKLCLVLFTLHVSTVRKSDLRTKPMSKGMAWSTARRWRCLYRLVGGLEGVSVALRPPHRSPPAFSTAPLPQKWNIPNHTWWFGIKGPPSELILIFLMQWTAHVNPIDATLVSFSSVAVPGSWLSYSTAEIAGGPDSMHQHTIVHFTPYQWYIGRSSTISASNSSTSGVLTSYVPRAALNGAGASSQVSLLVIEPLDSDDSLQFWQLK
ncbi:hypothetical protein C8F04DRAFT_244397 [Mycena alexandri]|uniref:Uncharacterized protein n=1 Tax=Mycena alexandri TaxID=1745969 RepID=A0AAD6WSR2_9AGAR|nr:hypothetical protein C8F04DRAFT_244397 [Mycena alexandri]